MTAIRRPATILLAAALALGISADLLLRGSPPGIAFTFWMVVLLSTPAAFARLLGKSLVGGWTGIAGLAALCALGISWRDSSGLTFFNCAGALGGCALIATRTSSRTLRQSSAFEMIHGMLVHLVHAIAGAGFLLAREAFPARGGDAKEKSPLPSVFRGAFIAAPFLVLFGSLFAAADARFQGILGSLFDFDLSTLFVHMFVAGSVAWIAAGFLRGSLIAEEVPAPRTLREAFFSLGIIEVGMSLGLIDGLFLLFVALQVPYLFGGAERIASDAALTYADYARRGFFELTFAACFTIMTLLLAEWILRKENPRAVRLFRALAGLNLVLLGIIMASAWQRLILYQAAYGLTEARLYAAAALTGIGAAAVIFACTVLTGRRAHFLYGVIIAAYAVILLLDIINPDALIARIDIARGSEGKQVDAAYLARLSADAAPDLIAGLPRLAGHDRGIIADGLACRAAYDSPTDWRGWNISRVRAGSVIQQNIDSLMRSRTEK